MACGVCCEEPLIYNTLSKMRTPPGSRKGYFLCWKRARWNCGSFGDPCGTKEIMQTLHDLPAISSLWLRRTCGSLGEVLSQQVLCAGELDAFPTPKTYAEQGASPRFRPTLCSAHILAQSDGAAVGGSELPARSMSPPHRSTPAWQLPFIGREELDGP